MSRRAEVGRKAIHVGVSLAAGGVVRWLAYPADAVVLAAAALVALAIELARQLSPAAAEAFDGAVGSMLRPAERRRLTGATTLAVGYAVAAAAFPGTPALGAILYVGIGDAAAAVVGRRWGRRRFPGGKSLEGSLSFLVCVFLLSLLLPGVGAVEAIAVAAILAVAEAFTFRIGDNLYLPVVAAALLSATLRLSGTQVFS